MSENTNIKFAAGATEFKKVCLALLDSSDLLLFADSQDFNTEITKNVSSPIVIEKSGDFLTVAKHSGQAAFDRIDFQFKFRLSFTEKKSEWWPVFFEDSAGHTIEAEVLLGGRTLTNLHKQKELIELANTWAKSLSSQTLKRTIEGKA